MGAGQVIIQSAAWNEVKKALYRMGIGQPLPSGHTDLSAAGMGPGRIFIPSEVIDVVTFTESGISVNDCVITVQQTKNIIKTPIQGRNGTVKEYISDGDYQVTLKGRISSNQPDVFPSTEVSNLVSLLQVQDALEIESEYLRECYGVTVLVVESYNMQRKEGMSSEQEYEIKCISHQPIELTINEL